MTKITVNELLFDHLIYHKRTYNGRYLAIGRSGKRLIAIVIRRIKACTYYVVTARDASKKERRDTYEKEKKAHSPV